VPQAFRLPVSATTESLFFPGQSPFRVKGQAYRGTVERVRERLAAEGKTFRDVLDVETALFFEQPFLAATFYDVLPIVPLVRLGARLEGLTMSAFVDRISRDQALTDISGVYRLLLRVASPEMVAKRLPRLTAQYFNFGIVEDEGLVAPGKVRMVRRGLPEEIIDWYTTAACSYVSQVLAETGAVNPGARVLGTEPDEPLHGVATRSMRFEFTWST
jgi:hypothetical protein